MLIFAGVLHFITPPIVTLGRSLDFVPRNPAPPGMQRFRILHGAYTTLEIIELVIGAVVTISLAGSAPTPAAAPRVG